MNKSKRKNKKSLCCSISVTFDVDSDWRLRDIDKCLSELIKDMQMAFHNWRTDFEADDFDIKNVRWNDD